MRPFDSWAQIRSVAERLGPLFGPMIVFAAATGLRPSELQCQSMSRVTPAAAGGAGDDSREANANIVT
jgi:hypothetical protein